MQAHVLVALKHSKSSFTRNPRGFESSPVRVTAPHVCVVNTFFSVFNSLFAVTRNNPDTPRVGLFLSCSVQVSSPWALTSPSTEETQQHAHNASWRNRVSQLYSQWSVKGAHTDDTMEDWRAGLFFLFSPLPHYFFSVKRVHPHAKRLSAPQRVVVRRVWRRKFLCRVCLGNEYYAVLVCGKKKTC